MLPVVLALGVATTFHVLPSQCSASVRPGPCPAVARAHPTDQRSLRAVPPIDTNWASPDPPGVATACQVPSQVRALALGAAATLFGAGAVARGAVDRRCPWPLNFRTGPWTNWRSPAAAVRPTPGIATPAVAARRRDNASPDAFRAPTSLLPAAYRRAEWSGRQAIHAASMPRTSPSSSASTLTST